MSKSKTKVIFIWHMHQPCYRHPDKKYYILPWVRLHAVKDYYGMARTVEKFDKTKVVFNFSGILLEQLLDYAQNNAKDYYLILTLKKPQYLKYEERDFIIKRFFLVDFERFIRPNPRYLQLYNKKVSARSKFNTQDILDLQTLFNLAWFHPYSFVENKQLASLLLKHRDYNEDDKEYIINKQYEIMQKALPLYKKLLSDKKIELSLTPYHHPIMPLIYDTDVLEELPYLKKPTLRFSNPIDCFWHLEQSQEIFERTLGYVPLGSWPSEGSVSEEVVSLYRKKDFHWLGADEAILFKSLTTENVSYERIKAQRHLIYRPYAFKGVNIFFRDRNLSDMISFTYQGWEDSNFAAQDLIEHFKRIHNYAKDIFKERCITIIMDGENAWEHYSNNGVDFLESLYTDIEKSPCLTTAIPLEYLSLSAAKNIDRLASGSWINGDFGVWIGSKKNNFYWCLLRKVRDELEKSPAPLKEQAMKYFYLLEGSDWFWWNTFEDTTGEFKNIFYAYVEKIYQLLGKKSPMYIK